MPNERLEKAKAAAKASLEAKRAHKARKKGKKTTVTKSGAPRKPHDPLKHPRGAKGRFIRKATTDRPIAENPGNSATGGVAKRGNTSKEGPLSKRVRDFQSKNAAGAAASTQSGHATTPTKDANPAPVAQGHAATPPAGGANGAPPPTPHTAHAQPDDVRINEDHIFKGEINPHGKAVGYHHRPGGVDPPTARVATMVDPPDVHGVYRAEIQVFNPATGSWVAKKLPSTFYPDSWSGEQVLSEIQAAYRNRTAVPNKPANYWEGTSPSGITFAGYLDPAGILHSNYPRRLD